MDDHIQQEVFELVGRHAHVDAAAVRPGTRLRADLGLDGERASRLLAEFALRFRVDMSLFSYAEYFREERNIYSWAPARPDVPLRELTAGELATAAMAGRWRLE